MGDRLLQRLGVKCEDRMKLMLLAPISFLCGISEMLIFNGYLTLFNERFGSEYLPYMYAAEAFILPMEAWALSWLAGKLPKPRLMRGIYLLMGIVITVNAVILLGFHLSGADCRFYYPLLFLSSSFVIRQQTILLWSLVVDVCPTQQSKRLMPFFVSAAALGGIVAGLISIAVSKRFGADVVYMLGPILLLAGSVNYFQALTRYLVPMTLKKQITVNDDGTERALSAGYYRSVFTRPYILAIMGILTVMPGLYFLMEYVFLNVARTIYDTESAFSSFFGLITALLFTLALLLQLVAGRIQAWLGSSNVPTAIILVFGVGFAAIALTLNTTVMLYAISLGYMIFYILIYYMAEPANQAFFRVLPIERRDGYRYVVQGLAASAGIGLGALMQWLHIGAALDWHTLAWMGAAVSAGLVLLARYARRLYMDELVNSVRSMIAAGTFVADTFQEFSRHSRFASVMSEMLDHPNDDAREVALSLIGRYKSPAFLPKLLQLLEAPSARIRMAAIMAIDAAKVELKTLFRMAVLAEDPDYEVRTAVIRQLGMSGRTDHEVAEWVLWKLNDPHPQVVAEAVLAMNRLGCGIECGECSGVIEDLLKRGGDSAVYICRVIGVLGLEQYAAEICHLLGDLSPAVREAAIESLGKLRYEPAIPLLLEQLKRAESTIQETIREAFVQMGPQAELLLLSELAGAEPRVWAVVVRSLAKTLTEAQVRERLVPEAAARLAELWNSRAMPVALRDWDLAGIAEIRLKELRIMMLEAAWAIMERLADESVIRAVRLAAEDDEAEVRESAIEVLTEGIGDNRLTAAVLPCLTEWLEEPQILEVSAFTVLRRLAENNDPWLSHLAAEALRRGEKKTMAAEGRQLMGLLDKVVFLKQVPFFSELSLDELGRVAGIAEEQYHKEGTRLFTQGTSNKSMGVIVKGRVSVFVVNPTGESQQVTELRENHVYGENSSLYGTLTTASGIVAGGDLDLLAIDGDKLAKLIRLYPGIGIGLLRAAFDRVRRLEQSIAKR